MYSMSISNKYKYTHTGLYIVAAILILFMLFNNKLVIVRVSGFSMEPTYHEGQIVTLARFKADKMKVETGDIILYRHSEDIILHRVYEVKEDGTIITKGDAFENVDSYTLTIDDVIGLSKY